MNSKNSIFKSDSAQNSLFDTREFKSEKPQRCAYTGHVWTRNKAHLIQRYLYRFAYVTKSSQYIDAFAGHQREESSDQTWAAKLALENEPKWLKRFFLFELDEEKIPGLQQLKNEHDKGWRRLSTRKVEVIHWR